MEARSRKQVTLAEPLLEPREANGGCVVWKWIFYVNVFMACISFSIVMPSLFLYLQDMGSSASFYALVVASYSVGEAVGSLTLGALSNTIGARSTLQLCALISLSGSLLYAFADAVTLWVDDGLHAPLTVLLGRFLQGVGSGGQQAVEQSYLSIAAPPEERTELTSKIATAATLGFIFGPAFGAAVSQTPDFAIGPLRINTFTKQGWVVAVLNVSMLLTTTFLFVEAPLARSQSPAPVRAASEAADKSPSPDAQRPDAATGDGESVRGVWALIIFFFVHFNGFAVQETITTPLINDWFGWNDTAANLLFTAAGVLTLVCALAMSSLSSVVVHPDGSKTQRVDDRVMLVASFALALLGWLVLVPPDGWVAGGSSMGVGQFLVGFGLVTIAFPFGRGLCLAMVGKLLGDQPQGTWMGIMLALGAIARIAGPFWAVTGYYAFGALAVFGSTAVLFLVSLGASYQIWHDLAPTAAEPRLGVQYSTARGGNGGGRERQTGRKSPRAEPLSPFNTLSSIHDARSPRLTGIDPISPFALPEEHA